jgi:hypothetical protein
MSWLASNYCELSIETLCREQLRQTNRWDQDTAYLFIVEVMRLARAEWKYAGRIAGLVAREAKSSRSVVRV